jgi:hypothetical protein
MNFCVIVESATSQLENSSKTIREDEHTGKPSTLMMNVNKESEEKRI